ncbi:MAG TPA: alcohol dehydrogenase catalytic domain-containing protein [Baekduia sp.]|nr:alcohol dehydrogenase catalytic domain-containing protein [Baekduia sp.]
MSAVSPQEARVAVVTVAPGTFEIRPEAQPAPGNGEVVVQTLATGVCGSDVHLFQGDHPYAQYPRAQGHEVVGHVASVGAGVDASLEGALVVVEPTLECGACAECARGAYNRCEQLEVVGVQRDGSLAGRFVTRASKVHPVPEGGDPASWALAEPVAVGCHAVDQSGLGRGDLAVVLGAGVIGLSIALALRRRSPGQVIVIEPSEERRRRVEELGLGAAAAPDDAARVIAAANASGADVVFEATGVPEVLGAAHELVRPGGRIVVVGQSGGDFSLPMIAMTRKELELVGTRNSANNFPEAIDLLAGAPEFIASVVTHRFHPRSAAEALAELTRPGTSALKVLLEVA